MLVYSHGTDEMNTSLHHRQEGSVLRMTGFVTLFLWLLALTTADQIRLSFQPKPEDSRNSLIWFNSSTFQEWSQQLDNYLEVYRTPTLTEGRSETLVECSYNQPLDEETVCDIKTEMLDPCVSSNYFGFKQGKPCIMIEFEKVLNWKPKFYNSTKSLPKNMPFELKKKLEEIKADGNKAKWENIWLSCDGETPVDKEAIGPVKYMPFQGFPGYMFPYTGQAGYLNPIVAVYFEHPARSMIINIECKAWAPGIKHDLKHQIGLTRFQLLIDD